MPNRRTLLVSLLLLALLSIQAHAQEKLRAVSTFPRAAFYVGLGAGVVSTKFNDQEVSATGQTDVFDTNTGEFITSGEATGPPVGVDLDSETTIAPVIQVGYFRHFEASNWLWGAKFSYSPLGASSTTENIRIPQTGSFGDTPFTGNALLRSFEVSTQHTMSFLPYIGHSFESSFVYLGGGPILSQIKTQANGLVGFADINGRPTELTGAPQDFNSSEWVFGGAGIVGVTYFLDQSWFLDFNYTFARTADKTANYEAPFTNVKGDETIDGTLLAYPVNAHDRYM